MTSNSIYLILSSVKHNKHYLEKYVKFINACVSQNNEVSGNIKHHICPKSIFKEYSNLKIHKWNCSILTKRQHWIAHKFLAKIFGRSQVYALMSMSGTRDEYKKLTSKEFEKLSIQCSGTNHKLYGLTWEQRYGTEIAAEMKIKISGENASSKLESNRKANSAAKQNRKWVNNGIEERFIDKSDIPENFIDGRLNSKSTITQSMIERSLKYFGVDSEEQLKELLTKNIFVENFSKTKFDLKYKKDSTCKFRDPSIRYFLKKFNLYDKL